MNNVPLILFNLGLYVNWSNCIKRKKHTYVQYINQSTKVKKKHVLISIFMCFPFGLFCTLLSCRPPHLTQCSTFLLLFDVGIHILLLHSARICRPRLQGRSTYILLDLRISIRSKNQKARVSTRRCARKKYCYEQLPNIGPCICDSRSFKSVTCVPWR